MKAKVNYKQLGLDILEFIKEFGELLPVPLEGKYQYARRLRRIQKYPHWKVNDKVESLEKGKFIFQKKDGEYGVTKKGEITALTQTLINSDEPVEYGKELIVVFDIPERKRRVRRQLRTLLLDLGFRNIQKSVFVGKKYLPKEFGLLLSMYGVKNFVRVFVAKEVVKL